jgi:hypothetical protein
VSGHALRDLDAPAVGQVVGNADGAEGVAVYRGFDAGVRAVRLFSVHQRRLLQRTENALAKRDDGAKLFQRFSARIR